MPAQIRRVRPRNCGAGNIPRQIQQGSQRLLRVAVPADIHVADSLMSRIPLLAQISNRPESRSAPARAKTRLTSGSPEARPGGAARALLPELDRPNHPPGTQTSEFGLYVRVSTAKQPQTALTDGCSK